ncbi:MAG: hypothetical protein GY937_00415 [bacterium]|nr:hypothetical protein [bacterium]
MRRFIPVGTATARKACFAGAGAAVLILLLLPKPWELSTGPGFADVPGRPFREIVAISLFWGTAFNGLLCLVLAGTARLWSRPLETPLRVSPQAPISRRIWIGLLLLAALAGALRWPISGRSLWWDEGWSIDRVIVGQALPSEDDPDRLEHEPPAWSHVLWRYGKPTNHIPYNLLARVSVDAERIMSGAESWQFSDRAFHLPAVLASMLSVILLGVFVWRLGFPGAALAAAGLLAIHPWHLRYGAEGRAYTLSVLIAVGAALLLQEALRCGRFRQWLAYGASMTLLMWIQPAHIYLAVAFSVAALAGIALTQASRRDRATLLLRFVVVNVLAVMAFVALCAPLISQAMDWSDVWQSGDTVNAGVLRRVWVWMTLGVPFRAITESIAHDPFPSFQAWMETAPWLGALVFQGAPLLVAIGFGRVVARPGPARWPLVALVLAPALILFVSWANQMYFYPRFVIYAAAVFAALLAIAAEGALALAAARFGAGLRRVLVPAGLLVLVAAFQWLVWPETQLLLTRPYSPMREVAERLRTEAGDSPSSILRAGYGLGGGIVRIYDPWIQYVDEAREIVDLERESRRAEKELYVFYGYPRQNEAKRPDGIALLLDPERYAEVGRFQGIEPQFTYRLFRYLASGETEEGSGGL